MQYNTVYTAKGGIDMVKKKVDPLDEIFMNKRDEKFFNFGRSNMLAELKRNKRIELTKVLKDDKVRELSGRIFELKESLKAVERAVKYWKDRATRMRMAIDNSDVILAVDGNSAGFAAECTYITEKGKDPHKAVLFINNQNCASVDAVLNKNDYKTLFCKHDFYENEDELINKCVETAKHRCKRLSMMAEHKKEETLKKE